MTASTRPLEGAALVGRRVGIAIFWCLASFVLFACMRSVLTELYGKPAQSGDVSRCAAELHSLHASLVDQASADLKAASDLDHTQRWLRVWDVRFASTRDLCGGLWDTRARLQSLRRHLETLLRQYVREQRPLTERLERALSHRSLPQEPPACMRHTSWLRVHPS